MSKAPIVDPLSTNVGDEALYGPATLPPVRANAVQQIPLGQIRPDWKQPRRAIPVTVMYHDWKTVNSRRLLGTWITQVCTALGKDTVWMNQNLPKWLRSSQPLPDLLLDKAPGVAVDFFELVSLAASIFSHGLTNPITVVQEGDHYVIETGERRFLAYNLLSVHLLSDRKWDSIPALVVQQSDVWRQAAENGSRQPLNAIGMARQIALLVMDMYKGDEGVSFQRFEDLVSPGECDQAYYAQVKKGTTYPIKKGELERVLAVTGLKSSDHVSLYRQLLDIDPELWVKADRENLTEGAIRALRTYEKPAELPPAPPMGQRVVDGIIERLPQAVLAELVVHRDGEPWTRETQDSLRSLGLSYLLRRNSLSDDGRAVRNRHREMAQEEKRIQGMIQRAHVRYERDQDYVPEQEDAIQVEQTPVLTLQVNDRVLVDGAREGTIRYVDARKGTYGVFLDASSTTHHYGPARVTFVSREEAEPEEPQPAPEAEEPITWQSGDRVLLDGTYMGTVRYIAHVLASGTNVGANRYIARYGENIAIAVTLDHNGRTNEYPAERLEIVDRAAAETPAAPEPSQPAADSPTIVGLSLAQDDKYLTAVLEHCRELSELLGLPDYVQYTMHKLQMMAPANVLAMQKNPVAAGKVLDTYEMHATMLLEGLQARVFTYIQDLRDSVEQAS